MLFDFPLASMRESSTWKEILISSSSRSSGKGQFHNSLTTVYSSPLSAPITAVNMSPSLLAAVETEAAEGAAFALSVRSEVADFTAAIP
jgi:hypothetical protein